MIVKRGERERGGSTVDNSWNNYLYAYASRACVLKLSCAAANFVVHSVYLLAFQHWLDQKYCYLCRTCAGCHNPIGHGRFLSCMGSVWHPECFRCFACNKPISEYEVYESSMFVYISVLQLNQLIDDSSSFVQFAMHDDQPYHRSCYKEFFHPKCDVCDNFVSVHNSIVWISMKILVSIIFLICL